MFSRIPTAIIKMTREVPPALIKGRVWPVGGTELVATPMLTATCRANTRVISCGYAGKECVCLHSKHG